MKQLQKFIILLGFLVIFSFLSVDEAKAAATSEAEPNNASEFATEVQSADEIEGMIDDNEDLDYYKISLPYESTFEVYSYLGNYYEDNGSYYDSYKLKLYSESGELLQTSSEYNYYDDEDYQYYYYQTIKESLPEGNYYLAVEVTDDYYDLSNQSYTIFQYTEFTPDFEITSITPSNSKMLIKDKTVKLTTKANQSNLQYQYSINDKVVRAFSSTATYNWKPTVAGTYTVKVEVRKADSPNAIISKETTYKVHDGAVKISSFKPSLTSPGPTNKTIKWTAKAQGVDLQYKFSVYSNKKWSSIQNYSSKNAVNWKPKNAGNYKIKVEVRSKASGKKAYKTVNYSIFKPSAFSITSFKANKKSPQTAGTYITYSARAKGEHLEYRFRVNNGYGWYTAQDYSGKRNFSVSPYYSGKLTVAVNVRQKGTTKVKTKKVKINIKENPSYYMNANYDIPYNSGYLKVTNNGYKNLKVTKLQLINDDKTIYSYSPKDWITIGRNTETFYYYPKNKLTKFNYYTYWKITYIYDGLTHTAYLYR